MTIAALTVAVLALLLVADASRSSTKGSRGHGARAGILERSGHTRAAWMQAGAGIALLALAFLGSNLARLFG